MIESAHFTELTPAAVCYATILSTLINFTFQHTGTVFVVVTGFTSVFLFLSIWSLTAPQGVKKERKKGRVRYAKLRNRKTGI